MAKKSASRKKKTKFVRPRRDVLIFAAVVVGVALIFGAVSLQHNRAVAKDKARFAQAGNDVETIADQIVAAVGQPADRKDGGKCRYASQKFGKGALTCEVYAYLAYTVNSPAEVNAIVKKAESVPGLHSTPWKFKAVTEKPHQFSSGVSYSDDFVVLRDLFDTEVKTVIYTGLDSHISCAVNYLFYNSIQNLSGYPDFETHSPQTLLFDLNCGGKSLAMFFPVLDK